MRILLVNVGSVKDLISQKKALLDYYIFIFG